MKTAQFSSDITVELVEHSAADARVVASARVSTQGQRAEDQLQGHDEHAGLINFLMRNRHGTPFEHNMFTFLVRGPIFMFREWHRHRIGWSYNEESGRYKELDGMFYIPNGKRNLVQTGKPGAYEFHSGTTQQWMLVRDYLQDANQTAYDHYQSLLSSGIAKEVARMCLPVNIYTSMYATCNARSLMAFLSLRTDDETATFSSKPMREIEIAARQMENVFANLMPLTYAAYQENGRVCP